MEKECYFCDTRNDSVEEYARTGAGIIPLCRLCTDLDAEAMKSPETREVLIHISRVGTKILEALDYGGSDFGVKYTLANQVLDPIKRDVK